LSRWYNWRMWPWWLIGMVSIVVCATMFVMRPPSQSPWNSLFKVCMLAAIAVNVLSAWIYLVVVPRDLPKARRRRGECESYGYTLTTGMHTCPECGQQRRV
jgi:hypothetical protein